MKRFECRFTRPGMVSDAVAAVEKEGLLIECPADKGTVVMDYADLFDFRLINYHLFLERADKTWELSHLGYNTEEFYEQLWDAYDARTRDSLFLSGRPLMETEGDFQFFEDGMQAKGKAKIALYPDSLCILPNNVFARRVPLCFADEPVCQNYRISVRLDTGDQYIVARLGSDTDSFFELLVNNWKASLNDWTGRHRKLKEQITRGVQGDDRVKNFCAIAPDAITGLFGPQDDGFWMAAIRQESSRLGEPRSLAAIEFITGEKAATYLYTFDREIPAFTGILRHAMESTGSHRELIYLDEEKMNENALYRMAVMRNRYIRFLRSHMSGRVIHNSAWKKDMSELLTIL